MMLDELKQQGEAPEWMGEEGFKILSNGYMLPTETPRTMYWRVASAAADYFLERKQELGQKFFDAMWKNWLCPASPVLSNLGTDRGLPISCNSIHVGDSVDSIFNKAHELAMLSKNGAGVGIYLGDVRGRNAVIKGNGRSEGVIPWAKVYDSTTVSVSQGSTRRGASAIYLPIRHVDIEEFINMRRPTGDTNRRCLNTNHGICIDDSWMQEMLAGDKEKRVLWQEILKARVETGEPYLFFIDNVNKANPDCYVQNGLTVKTSNICCLGENTLVATKNGVFPIKDLQGKTVEIWDGNRWIKNDTFQKRGEDTLFRIHIKDGSFVDCNPGHRWFVTSGYEGIRKNDLLIKTTKELKIGDFIEYHSEEFHGEHVEKGAYLKGFLLGDGTHIKGRPLLRLHSTKYCCINQLIESGKEIEPEEVKTNGIKELCFSKEYNFSNGKAYGIQLLKNMKGLSVRKKALLNWSKDYKKEIPLEVLNWNKQSKLDLLSGILDSDGTVSKTSCSIQISSIHEKFIHFIQSLLKTLGVNSSVDLNSYSNRNDVYRLTISSYDGYDLLNQLSCQRLKYVGAAPNRKTTGWRKIVKIEQLEGTYPVYCPVLPTTGKFGLANGLMTGNTEIMLHTDADHSFVCCLSSLNLVKWDEWKDTDLVKIAIYFLDAVLSEYIHKAKHIPGFEPSVRSAEKGRAIGLGVLGWHTLLQQNMIPFDSFEAMMLNAKIFQTIKTFAESGSSILAKELGEPEWCLGFGRRNTHLLAIAPTVSNSTISGGHSAGIEPIAANIFSQKSAKGTFIRKNIVLQRYLESLGLNTPEVWKSINEQSGSVQHLSVLDDKMKEVFLTAREINQHAIVKQAAQRQKWIDQGQSVNLFFSSNSSAKYVHEVHLAAWELGLKSLYYLRTEGVIKGDLASRSKEECKACEG